LTLLTGTTQSFTEGKHLDSENDEETKNNKQEHSDPSV